MLERSDIKHIVFDVLSAWNHAETKATTFNIAKKCGCSESSVQKVLRVLQDIGLADSSRGSWRML